MLDTFKNIFNNTKGKLQEFGTKPLGGAVFCVGVIAALNFMGIIALGHIAFLGVLAAAAIVGILASVVGLSILKAVVNSLKDKGLLGKKEKEVEKEVEKEAVKEVVREVVREVTEEKSVGEAEEVKEGFDNKGFSGSYRFDDSFTARLDGNSKENSTSIGYY